MYEWDLFQNHVLHFWKIPKLTLIKLASSHFPWNSYMECGVHPPINKVDEDENFAGLILKGIGSHMQRPLGMFGILELEKYFQQGSKHD